MASMAHSCYPTIDRKSRTTVDLFLIHSRCSALMSAKAIGLGGITLGKLSCDSHGLGRMLRWGSVIMNAIRGCMEQVQNVGADIIDAGVCHRTTVAFGRGHLRILFRFVYFSISQSGALRPLALFDIIIITRIHVGPSKCGPEDIRLFGSRYGRLPWLA